MSDRIAVMNDGRVAQCGPPEDIYEHPTEEFVAGFIGISNLLEGVVEDGGKVRIANGLEAPGAAARRTCDRGDTVQPLGPAGEDRRRRDRGRAWSASRARSRPASTSGSATQITVSLGDGATPGRARAGDLPRQRRRPLGAGDEGQARLAPRALPGPALRTPACAPAVIGAGLAGLSAADALAREGWEVDVLEARDRVGGRTWSRRLANGATIEMGAEFILAGNTEVRGARRRARPRALGQGHALRRPRAPRRDRDDRGRALADGGARGRPRARPTAPRTARVRELLDSLPIDAGAARRSSPAPRSPRPAPPTRSPPATWPASPTSATSRRPSVAGGNQGLALGAGRARSGTRVRLARPGGPGRLGRRRLGPGRRPPRGTSAGADRGA